MPSVAFWYDFASPAGYPAAMTVARKAADAGVAVRWRPVSLGSGRDDDATWRDMARACEAAGVPLARPTVFPRDSRPALRAALACEAEGLDIAAFSRAVFDANFSRDQDISDVGRLGELLAEIDMPGAAVLAHARSPEIETALAAQTRTAATHGLSGAPALTTPDGARRWDVDHVDEALAHAACTDGDQ